MKLILLTTLLILCAEAAAGQHVFDIKNASRFFDVKVEVAKCDGDGFCEGKAKFSFYKKGTSAPYQHIELDNTSVQLTAQGAPSVNISLLYDQQSVINVGDFNFDGMEDVAICNGNNGSYGGPSYNVYLSSRAARKFVYSPALSALGEHLGMFEVNSRTRTLQIFDKSGCCWHMTARYKVANNRPVKVFEETEEMMATQDDRVKTVTKRLVNGRWHTTVRVKKLN